MMIEMLRPAGPELARRWLAILTVVPEHERAGVVEAVERSVHAEFGPTHGPVPRTDPDGPR
ncbi:MAG: hypothetical protein AAFR96_00410 [Planctomycetota bacterium]